MPFSVSQNTISPSQALARPRAAQPNLSTLPSEQSLTIFGEFCQRTATLTHQVFAAQIQPRSHALFQSAESFVQSYTAAGSSVAVTVQEVLHTLDQEVITPDFFLHTGLALFTCTAASTLASTVFSSRFLLRSIATALAMRYAEEGVATLRTGENHFHLFQTEQDLGACSNVVFAGLFGAMAQRLPLGFILSRMAGALGMSVGGAGAIGFFRLANLVSQHLGSSFRFASADQGVRDQFHARQLTHNFASDVCFNLGHSAGHLVRERIPAH
ncbi:MAG: hypothetical protein HQM15_08075 [Deltaproteobacteria bacterium]|nr:hypothetical protein [Deltaproteobacteria bacterium]